MYLYQSGNPLPEGRKQRENDPPTAESRIGAHGDHSKESCGGISANPTPQTRSSKDYATTKSPRRTDFRPYISHIGTAYIHTSLPYRAFPGICESHRTSDRQHALRQNRVCMFSAFSESRPISTSCVAIHDKTSVASEPHPSPSAPLPAGKSAYASPILGPMLGDTCGEGISILPIADS